MKFLQSRILTVLALLSTALSRSLDVFARQDAQENAPAPQSAPTSRFVYVISDVNLKKRLVAPNTGKDMFDMHTALHVEGTATDGPLRIEVAINAQDVSARGLVIRVKDLGVANTGKPIGLSGPPNTRRYIVQNGQITFTNAEIFDHQAGDGLVTDAWKENPLYSRGTGQTPNTCLDFVYRLLEHMNLDLDPAMNTIFASGDAYYTIPTPKNSVSQNVPHVWSEKLELPDGYKPPPGVDTWARIFDVLQDPKQPTLMLDSAVVCKTKMAKRQCTNPEQFGEDTWFSDTITEEELDGLLAGTPPDDSSRIPSIAEETRGAVQPFQDAVGTPETAGTDLATIGMGRAAGVVSAVWLVAREVAQGLGQVVGPAFVLLDMVQGNWVGAGLAAVGLALGAAISMAGAGLVGWIVGGIIAALFTILPGAWKK